MQLLLTHGIARNLIMGLIGAVAAYVTLALASTLVQELWLGGVSYQRSAPSVLILAGVFTPLCAFVAGIVGSLIAGRARWLATTVLCGFITVENAYLYGTGRVDGPLWFEAGAASALMIAACVATWLMGRPAVRDRLPRRA
jgi:uncharacterized membrane protein YeaQ/YmgE (transglycosylase-associated protein family)